MSAAKSIASACISIAIDRGYIGSVVHQSIFDYLPEHQQFNVLDGGRWQGKLIISEQWVEKSTMPIGGNRGIKVAV